MDFERIDELNTEELLQEFMEINEHFACYCFCNDVFTGDTLPGYNCYTNRNLCASTCQNRCGQNYHCSCRVYYSNESLPYCYF